MDKWDELGADWTNLPAGVGLYSGFYHIMSAINERHKVARQDPNYVYYDLTQLEGQLASGTYGNFQIAVQIRNGLIQLEDFFISPDADAYNTLDPFEDNYRRYDTSGIPSTFGDTPSTLGTLGGQTFEECYGQDIQDIFQVYIDTIDDRWLPNRQMLTDAYNILQEFYILRSPATECNEYSKTALEAPGAGVDGAFVNGVYSSTPVVTTVTDGSCRSPGFIYYHATLGTSAGGPNSRSWFTGNVDTWSSGVNGSHRRTLADASTSGEFFYDIIDKDGNNIQPSLIWDGYTYWIATGGPYVQANGITFGDIGPTNSNGARSNYNQNALVYPRTPHIFESYNTAWTLRTKHWWSNCDD